MAFILYVLAFILLVFGGPALIVPKRFMKVFGGILKNSDMVRMMGLRTMFLSFFFLAMYPLLKGGRLMIISIIGWLSLIKSVVLLWFPGFAIKQSKVFYGTKTMTMIMGIICILFAAFVVWVGMAKF